jgi:hypothetical protein
MPWKKVNAADPCNVAPTLRHNCPSLALRAMGCDGHDSPKCKSGQEKSAAILTTQESTYSLNGGVAGNKTVAYHARSG